MCVLCWLFILKLGNHLAEGKAKYTYLSLCNKARVIYIKIQMLLEMLGCVEKHIT